MLFRTISIMLLAFFLLLGCLELNPQAPPAPDYDQPYIPPSQSQASEKNSASQGTQAPSLPLSQTAVQRSELEIIFFNVSFGDSTLIRASNRTILFDAGPQSTADLLVSKLRSLGVEKIDLLILSSNDESFVGGAVRIFQEFEVDEIWTNGIDYNDFTWAKIKPYLDLKKAKPVSYGHYKEWGGLRLDVLNPQKKPILTSPDADSIVLKASYKSFCALLFSNSLASGASSSDPGTVFGGIDNQIVSGPIPINCKVLKVSHHGSANAASFQLLNNALPSDAIISVGPNPPQNIYPEPALIRRLMLRNISVWTTDKLGDIMVSSNGSNYSISSTILRDAKYGRFIETVANAGGLYWTTKMR